MKNRKSKLNKLRSLVEQIIKEETYDYDYDAWKNINTMVDRFLKKENPDIEKLKTLDEMDFVALIYSLYTGQYEITGISNKGFLRHFMTGGTDENTNIPLKIINNLPYSKKDFINVLKN